MVIAAGSPRVVIAYTPYALWRMRRRRITPEEVRGALADPDIRYPSIRGRTVVRTRVEGRSLCVAYEARELEYTVISVFSPEERDGDEA
jgi:hypothetical protein